jgi:hypothetical protein
MHEEYQTQNPHSIWKRRSWQINCFHKIILIFQFSSQFALALSQDENTQVGLLDVDLCGPSIPKMMNLENEQLSQSNLGWQPAYYEDNLAVISIGFLLPNKDDPVVRSFKTKFRFGEVQRRCLLGRL